MCGITGIINKDGAAINKGLVLAMSRAVRHRGPDEEGYYFDQQVALGIQRLKIIDLETGSQPIHNEDKSIWVVLNGEIYNYRDLRRELEAKGHKFYTRSDTETIVHAYEEWGDNFIEHLSGIFGFALWDTKRQRLMLVRDRVGVKPLYYYEAKNLLVFGSEIKSILLHPAVERELDFEAFNNYLYFAYVPAPLTMFKGIKKLMPGHRLVWQGDSSNIRQYWDVSYNINADISEQEALERLQQLLRKAVKDQLIADVPLGLFLSGGIDSSILASLMAGEMDRPVTTFSIAFDEGQYNESKYAKQVAEHFGTDHREFVVRPDIIKELPKIIEHLDEPLANSTALPTFLLSKLAKEKVTVVLNGAGGDEIFGGYDRYRRQSFLSWYKKFPAGVRSLAHLAVEKLIPGIGTNLKTFKRRAEMIANALNLPLDERYVTWASVISADCREMILSERVKMVRSHFGPPDLDDVNKMMYADTKTYLVDDILTMTDKMSMAHALEIRVPFLDQAVVEFAATLPAGLKVGKGKSKYLLRKLLAQSLPESICNRPKQGFMVPISCWFREDKQIGFARDILLSPSAKKRGLFSLKGIEKMLAQHQTGERDHGGAIWALLNFELWYQNQKSWCGGK